MNSPDDILQTLQKGFHITVGATASLIEGLQNPQQREESLNKLRTDPYQLTEDWEAKGKVTEQEARNLVDRLLNQAYNSSPQPPAPTDFSAPVPPASGSVPTEIQQDLQELTTQIAAIRAELERLRENNP